MSIQLELFAEDEVVELEVVGGSVFLRLRAGDDGRVDVVLVNRQGQERSRPYLLRITSEGVYRQPGVNPEVGLPLSQGSRLTLVGE